MTESIHRDAAVPVRGVVRSVAHAGLTALRRHSQLAQMSHASVRDGRNSQAGHAAGYCCWHGITRVASPESLRPSTPPALVAASTPRAIHDALVGEERAEFARRYGQEMAAAAESLDLTGVLAVLATFREIAETTQRHGADDQGAAAATPAARSVVLRSSALSSGQALLNLGQGVDTPLQVAGLGPEPARFGHAVGRAGADRQQIVGDGRGIDRTRGRD